MRFAPIITLSIVIPVLDEEAGIADALAALDPLRARGVEVIVADGGSRDRTVELARPLCDRVIAAPRGRAAQMNAGAAATSACICPTCSTTTSRATRSASPATATAAPPGKAQAAAVR